jgi:hypothetical protein
MLRRLALHAAVIALATAGAIGACRNNVPAPAIPVASPEVTPGSPKPQDIDPEKAAKARKAKPKRVSEVIAPQPPVFAVQQPPVDAGVLDVVDLPPVVDADVALVRDAAQPLK